MHQTFTCALMSIPFIIYFFFLNPVLINQRNGPRYQRVLALCAFFFFFLTGVILKGLILRKIVFDVCKFFVLCGFVSGQNLWVFF